MSTALQRAHDQASLEAVDAAPPTPVVCTVAGPRRPFSSEIYRGAELLPTAARAGAYDALRMPSLFNGRRQAPHAGVFEATVWTPPPPSPHTPLPVAATPKRHVATPRPDRAQGPLRELTPGRRVRGTYLPRPGSVPSLLLEHLHSYGGHLTYVEIRDRFGLPLSSVTAVFKPAISAGVLVRKVCNQRAVLCLPGYTPPPDTPRPSKALQNAQARLTRRRNQVAQLEAEVLALQAAAQTE